MKLTDEFVGQIVVVDPKTAKKYPDGKSLFLLVNGVGKYWRWDYRFAGKRKTLALGVYPAVSLAEAREQCLSAREMVRSGIDPSEEKKANRQFQRAAEIGDRPRHPGAVLREALLSDTTTASPSLLAEMLRLPVETAQSLLDGLSSMTCEVALQLEQLLSIKAEKWMAMQQAVDLWEAREKFQRMRRLGDSIRLAAFARKNSPER